MSNLINQLPQTGSIAHKFQAQFPLDIPKRRLPLSAVTWRTKRLDGIKPTRLPTRPSHDLSTAHIITLIEKRLKWINRADLKIGLMDCYEDNFYMFELIDIDRKPIYQVFADATDARFYWVEA